MSLKSIASLIKAGDYDQAEKEVMALEKAGNANAMVYLCGLRCATEKGRYNTALHYLQKVKETDPKNPEAVKAECSIYEKFPEEISKDNISFLDKVTSDETLPDVKKKTLKKIKWCAMIRLGLFTELSKLSDYSEAMKDVQTCCLILNALTLGKKIPLEMVQTAFVHTKDELSQKEHLYGTLLFQNQPQFDEFAFEHALRFGCNDSNIAKNVYTKICYEFLKEGQLSPAFANAVKVKDFVQQNKPTTEWLTHLFANEIAQAYDSLSKLSSDEYRSWPLCGLAFYTFFTTRQFGKVLQLYTETFIVFPDKSIFNILELEALFENHADEIELKQILRTIESSTVSNEKRIIEIKLRIKIMLGIYDENEIDSADLESATKYQLLAELNFASKNYPVARKASQQSLESPLKDPWRSQLILAKLKWMVDEDFDEAELDLRQIYSTAPFVADIVSAMAEFYVEMEEFDSAKMLIDQAVLLNASNRGLRELQDKIYSILKVPVEDRIKNLNQFIALKPYSMWAVKHVTMLELKNGKYEEAVNKLRRAIHALPEDVDVEVRKKAATIWAYVGLVNLRRGQAKSAMYAFDSAVTLDPDNPSFLFQLALAQKKLYKFEQIFETLKKLRSTESSPEICKLAHSLFLQSLSSYASQLPPGRKQLYQLIILFKILGKTSNSEWSTSGALLLSIANGFALLREYNDNVVECFLQEISSFAQKCGISKKEEIWNAEIAIMCLLLSMEQNVGILNETGCRLLTYATKMRSQNLAEIARQLFRKAILTPGLNTNTRSTLYLNLALTFCIGTVNYESALHCCFRSLQLNKANPSALSLSGLLFLKMKNVNDATRAFNIAHTLEPSQPEHWYGRAILAELQNNDMEAMNLFQHSLTIEPCAQAVEAFSYYLVKAKAHGYCLNKFEFDYKAFQHLLHVNRSSDQFLYSMAIFAEHFRHFDEAASLINKLSSSLPIEDATKIRILAACGTSSMSSFPSDGLERLYAIYHGSLSEAVAAAGLKSSCLVSFLLASLAFDNWPMFWKFYRTKLYPLLVGFVNALEMDPYWSRGILSTLLANRPPHKFLQVFPFKVPLHYLTSAFLPREDEKAVVVHDPSIQALFDLLVIAETQYDKENVNSEEDSGLVPYDVRLDGAGAISYPPEESESGENESDISVPQ